MRIMEVVMTPSRPPVLPPPHTYSLKQLLWVIEMNTGQHVTRIDLTVKLLYCFKGGFLVNEQRKQYMWQREAQMNVYIPRKNTITNEWTTSTVMLVSGLLQSTRSGAREGRTWALHCCWKAFAGSLLFTNRNQSRRGALNAVCHWSSTAQTPGIAYFSDVRTLMSNAVMRRRDNGRCGGNQARERERDRWAVTSSSGRWRRGWGLGFRYLI